MPKTLLLADDSVTIQKVVGISFANEDVVLVTVDNGDEALLKAREIRPDIVLADAVMPGKNGYEVCEALKADPELRNTPVLLLTGTFEAFDEERATRAGADGHITKPFEAQALVDQVNARLAAVPAAPAPAPIETDPEPAAAAAALEFDKSTESSDAASDIASGADSAKEEAYEFFDEETTDPGPAETLSISREEPGDDLGVASQADDAFSFDAPDDVHEELSVEPDPVGGPPLETDPPDATEAIFDDSDAFANARTEPPFDLAEAEFIEPGAEASEVAPSDEPEIEIEPAPSIATEPAVEIAVDTGSSADVEEPFAETGPSFTSEAPPAAADAFPSLDGDPLASVSPEDVETVLDPGAARDYDVSSSDLGDPLAGPPASAEQTVVAGIPAAPARETADPFAPSTQPIAEAETFAAAETVTAIELEPVAPPPLAPVSEPEPREAPVFVATPVVQPPAAALEQSPATPVTEATTPRPDLSAEMKQQIHEALEKIAWEAFSEVSEKIVGDALERVEKVAWEVIPQMAETLIQEEIRKLKGDD